MSHPIPVSVQILDSEFRLSCLPEEEADLKRSAEYVDERLRKLKEESRLPIDKVAIVTALNLAHELMMQQEQTNKSNDQLEAKLAELSNLLERHQ